ncbi:cyclohexanone monooxygenase [Amycolatopsis bartoniae]|uniref:Cyclohexanone monooxygenase n=1 Tax=Amycolatopsis bartoniae TaxID=941986 RepID=A0A8H9MAG2_9PSEU|nr:NAD(P)/FAD-dependent oxidoreductase [Amycolatopsis bartoniae]MBB2939691.1 cyclohexanone monooxygenase [Amycolatopsis bartoniae]TVT06188.1 NAD(P)/FAD-dependent oxidoreductase [Amycolatopsis bartoniae]GHF36461.1 cyclohexanone monooxygenase [Amycolatopsis bartoniae]
MSNTYDAVVIGAGFAGLYALKKLRDDLGLSVVVYETGDDVGGTWYWNRYPGARCDAESIYYSYSFDPELDQSWTWSERFATQPEILAYAQYVAQRHDLRRDIRFRTRVVSATWQEAGSRWEVGLDDGETVSARWVVSAVGCLSAAQVPEFPGLEEFAGEVYHTGHWPHEGVDFTGKRVAVIGTGSSGIQAIPEIAKQAAHLTVFQRTPNFSLPARNRPLSEEEIADVKARYPEIRAQQRQTAGGSLQAPPAGKAADLTTEQQRRALEERWAKGGPGYMGTFADCLTDRTANDIAAEFVRERIHEIVEDPEVAALLEPTDYPIGTKRICVDTDYYATFNRDNVTLVSVKDRPIERITRDGVTVGGDHTVVDVIVFATGYDAMTGPLNRIDIRGKDGLKLRDKWRDGPRTYLGIASAGFPNLFIVTGPGSPSVLSNMVCAIEQHVEWIAGYVAKLRADGIAATEPDRAAEDQWVGHVNEVAHSTLYPQAASWYMGANIPGKPRIFMPYVGGLNVYGQVCADVAANGYRGFVHTRQHEREEQLTS